VSVSSKADNPFDELTLHEWAAAMKKKNLLPDVASLMSAQGFYGAPPSRAYATAGSFLRYLAETRGKEKLRDLYRDADFQRAYGEPLSKLAADYVTFLDSVPLEPNAVTQAFARFHRGSLFDRPCAREVNALADRAREVAGTNITEASALIARCRALQPDEPSHVLSQANALRREGDNTGAAALLDEELRRLAREPSPWADAALARVDLAVEQNDIPRARELLLKLLASDAAPAVDRTAHIRLDGLETPAINRYFRKADDAAVLLALSQAGDSVPLHYLLGRRLTQLGDAKAALPHLQLVLNQNPPLSLERETRRLAIEAAYASGNCPLLNVLAQNSPRYLDWAQRCAFAFP
jgi:tetratricopeptide (TPR) repeat protein